MTDDEFSTELAGYERVAPLGSAGSYARAFVVKDPSGGQWALKLAKTTGNEQALKRHRNEVWALQNLDHPTIPKFKAASEAGGRPYIVMSYVEGSTIEQQIQYSRMKSTKESQLKALQVAKRLLECLVYLDSKKIVHQDIKSDNVLVPEIGVDPVLIDFGLCHGEDLPENLTPLQTVGALLFSPPSKLRRPGEPKHKHDVFALGVMFFELLTHRLPWEFVEGEDPATLADRMEKGRPLGIRAFNSDVSTRVAEFFEKLLATADNDRPTAKAALEALKVILENVTDLMAAKESDAERFTRKTRVIRDPLHGDIRYTEFELAIINTPAFQRLRRLRQLGTSHFVYPGAEHTRFLHALGTLHTAERILLQIEQKSGHPLESHDRVVARAYALLHDISHAPFGHTLEDELGILGRHDENRARLNRILEPSTNLGDLLLSCLPGRDVRDLLLNPDGGGRFAWVSELVSGPTGADVIDYVDRDAMFCGLDHRVDSAIFRWFALDRLESGVVGAARHVGAELYGQHGFRLDGEEAAIALLRERHALFLKVYSHTKKVVAGAMVGKALLAAITHEPATFTEAAIEQLGDEELLALIGAKGGAAAERLIGMLARRQLYVPVYSASVAQGEVLDQAAYELGKAYLDGKGYARPEARADFERKLAKQAGADPKDIIFYVSPTPPGAQRVSHIVFGDRQDSAAEKRRRAKQEQIFSDHLNLWKFVLFVSPSQRPGSRTDLADLARSELRRRNELGGDQLQFDLR